MVLHLPEYAGQEMIVGLHAAKVAIADRDGTVVAEHDRAYGDAPTDTTDPASQLPLLCNKLRGWHESKVRANLPDGLRSYMDGLGRRAGRRREGPARPVRRERLGRRRGGRRELA